jgi:2-polyprenyl-3-methyl-5-hydroxy-6-metoxy-1,4-benzoquinol methylase
MLKHKRYDQGYFQGLLHREVKRSQRNYQRLEQILPLNRGGRLLEIGFGAGGFMEAAARYYDVHGIDVSRWAVRHAPSRLRRRVRVLDIEEQTLARHRYDVIAAYNVLEHIDDPPRALAHIARGLAPNGVLIGSVPNNGGVVGRVVTAIANLFDRTHVSTPPPEQWRAWLEEAQLQDVRLFGEVTLGHNHAAYIEAPLWRQITFNLMFVCRAPVERKATP